MAGSETKKSLNYEIRITIGVAGDCDSQRKNIFLGVENSGVNSPPAAMKMAVLRTDSVVPLRRLLYQTGVFPGKPHEEDP